MFLNAFDQGGTMTVPNPISVLASHDLRPLRRFVSSRVRNGEDADDVMQQTLLLAVRHIGQFRFEASFGTWLSRIALNEIRARLRRPSVSRMVFADPNTLENLGVHDTRLSPLAALEQKESKARLNAAIAKLPEIYRSVVELRDLRGLSIQETAEQLSLSKPAIKSRHLRARNQLLKLMQEPEQRSTERVCC